MKTREPFYILIILLMGGSIWYQIHQAKIQQYFAFGRNAQFADAIEKARGLAESYADSAQQERVKRIAQDSLTNIALNRLQMRNRTLSENGQKLREPVQTLIDTVQALGAFVRNQDSTLAVRQEIIDTLSNKMARDSVSFYKEFAQKELEIKAEKNVSDLLSSRLLERETELQAVKKDNKKLKFGNRVLKVVAVAGVLFGVWQAVK